MELRQEEALGLKLCAEGFEDEMCRGSGSEALVGVAVRQILEVWCCYRDAIIYSL